MARTTLQRALALVSGALTTVALWWFDAAPGLGIAAGLSVLVLGLAMSRVVRDHPTFTSASGSWRDRKWSAAGQVFVIVVAFQAVFAVEVPLVDQIGLHVVVLATFLVGYYFGGLDALDGDGRTESSTSLDGADPADD